MISPEVADTDGMKLSFGAAAAFFLTCLSFPPLWCQPVDPSAGQDYLQGGSAQDMQDLQGVPASGPSGEGASGAAASAALPPLLAGLWENSRRIVSFEGLNSASVILKLFYGWYYDRAAEPVAEGLAASTLGAPRIDGGASREDVAGRDGVAVTEAALQEGALPPRPRNDATAPQAQRLLVEFEPLIPETERSGAWNVWITYPGTNERQAVPVAVFDGKLYVDFFLGTGGPVSRFFQAASNTDGIAVSPPLPDKEVVSYLVTGSRMYRIRYWQTDMEYDGETSAVLTGGDGSHEVPKHLLIGGAVYTCVAGRRVDIRNVEEVGRDLSGFTMSGDERIVVRAAPYLSLMDRSPTELYQLVDEANSRRAPQPQPPLPLGDLDFHYAEIEDLRKYMVPQPAFPEFEDWEYIETATHQPF